MHSLAAFKGLTCLHTQRADTEKAFVEEIINSLNYGKTAGFDLFSIL